jgi:hypothetical protein
MSAIIPPMVALGAILLHFLGQMEAMSFIVGFVVSLANVLTLQIVWTNLLGKKSVAWPGALIVMKYTFLTYVLYVVVMQKTLMVFWFTLGLAAIAIPAVIFSLTGSNRGS